MAHRAEARRRMLQHARRAIVAIAAGSTLLLSTALPALARELPVITAPGTSSEASTSLLRIWFLRARFLSVDRTVPRSSALPRQRSIPMCCRLGKSWRHRLWVRPS